MIEKTRRMAAGALAAAVLVLTLSGCRQQEVISAKPADLVNTLMGTDSEYLLSHGNTYPAVALPFGMNFWTPQTRRNGDGWAYTYDDHKITGIKQTHQPSPWINDYAAFSLMPVTGAGRITEDQRASWFSHKAEEARPYFYSVYLADYDITAEVTPTERSALFRFTFPESDSSAVVIDAFAGGSMVKIIPEEKKIIGYCRNNHGGVPENFHNYFVIVFDREFDFFSVWVDGTLMPGSTEQEGDRAAAVVGFRTERGEKVSARVASSFISHEQAELMGGEEMMVQMLDSVFIVPPLFDDSYYGFPIHEIREMQIMNMGNYAHGNQPVQHMIYLYKYTPEPWKTEMRVREVMDRLYNYTPDGYCGDEDNGQTSAWYVFSALGFYPVTPGTGEYVLGSPLFRKATVTLSDGRKLVISAPENSRKNIYVNEVLLNGKKSGVSFVTHAQLQEGGELEFGMSEAPNTDRGISPAWWPYSMSTARMVLRLPYND